MLVTNDTAVLNAWSGATPGNPRDSGSDPCTRSKRYSTSTDSSEKARTEVA